MNAPSSWADDPIFAADHSDWAPGNFSSPAFRLTLQGSVDDAHPFDHAAAYSEIFAAFRPALEGRIERILMIDTTGGSPRRRKSVQPEDWDPVAHLTGKLRREEADAVGFYFQSGKFSPPGYEWPTYDTGPAGFELWIGQRVQLTATCAVDDWDRGLIDIERVRRAALSVPFLCGAAGFGLARSEEEGRNDDAQETLLPVAARYPALDIAHPQRGYWSMDEEKDPEQFWLQGVNWLTYVGRPFIELLGGADELRSGLPRDIIIDEGPHGTLFQLGSHPIAGTSGDGDLLRLYRELARRLAPPSGLEDDPYSYFWPVFGEGLEAESRSWERRFDGSDWFMKHDLSGTLR